MMGAAVFSAAQHLREDTGTGRFATKPRHAADEITVGPPPGACPECGGSGHNRTVNSLPCIVCGGTGTRWLSRTLDERRETLHGTITEDGLDILVTAPDRAGTTVTWSVGEAAGGARSTIASGAVLVVDGFTAEAVVQAKSDAVRAARKHLPEPQ